MTNKVQIEDFFLSLKSDFKGTVRLNSTDKIFVKFLANPPSGFFEAEINSYELLKKAIPANIPKILFTCKNGIALELLQSRPVDITSIHKLAEVIASIHSFEVDDYGANWNGFIGPLHMDNTPKQDYGEFFLTNRIEPYVKTAYDTGLISNNLKDKILEIAINFKDGYDTSNTPRIVHGDLWNGNIIFSDEPYIIDPAAYAADPEIDLAMIHLFSIPYLTEFMATYKTIVLLKEGYENRILVNQLFYLLVHVLIFEGHYVNELNSVADRCIRQK